MGKIGILTFFDADNYGALLQCYALSKYCEEINHEVKVLVYHSKKMFTWKYRLKRKIAKTAQSAVALDFFASGITMATNIP